MRSSVQSSKRRYPDYRAEPLESRVLLTRQVVGYFPDWEYMGGLLSKVDLSALTHVNYFSIVPNTNGSLPSTSASGHSFNNMDAVVNAAHAKGVKVSIVIGGAGLDHTMMPIAQSPAATSAFVTNIRNFCAAHSLDGVDLDYEPGWGTLTVAKINAYGDLINSLKAGAPELIISAAVNPLQQPTDAGSRYVVPLSAVNSLDLIHIMGYDIQIPNHSEYNQSVNALANWYNYAAQSGVPKSKMVLGVPFYAHENSWATHRTYQFMVDNNPSVASNPALDNAGGWYFNGRTTIQNKSQYVVNNAYGGIMIWQLAQDHFTANLYDATSLLPVIKNTIGITNFITRDAAGNLVATGDASANVFTVNVTATSFVITLGETTRTYPLSLVSSLTINGLDGNDIVNFTGTTSKPIAFNGGTGSDTLNINAGTFTFNADAGAASPNLTVNVAAGASVVFNATQHLASLIVSGNATMTSNGNRVLVTDALSIPGGRLDLNDNDLVLDYTGATQLGAVQTLINQARNGGGWLGASGITSTAAKNNPVHNTTLGVMEASDFDILYDPGALFAGEAVDSDAVLVKYTYYGDTNFSGTVNFDDYVRVDVGFNTGLSGWSNGDLNGDGVVNFDDYVLLDVAFNTQGLPLSRAPHTPPTAKLHPRRPAAALER